MPVGFDPSSIEFDAPGLLWLLSVPAALLVLWAWQLRTRLLVRNRFVRRRLTPVREHFSILGGLGYWFWLIAATALVIVALAGPHAIVSISRTAGIDLIVLQDGSASMRVPDVAGNRWKRSTVFLRQLAESISWKDDRLALAVFAHIATPQIRLTRDPNTFFFFIDHLADESPFRLEDDTTWDTNIESGLYWGIRLIERDEQLHGKSPNAKAFVLISDGQAWSGEVEKSIAMARGRDIPVFVVGVGTSGGGLIPEPAPASPDPTKPFLTATPVVAATIHAALDRESLNEIANHGAGRYFELDRETDVEIADQLIEATRRRSGSRGIQRDTEDLHWRLLAAAAGCVALGVLLFQERTELVLYGAGAALAAWLVMRVAM